MIIKICKKVILCSITLLFLIILPLYSNLVSVWTQEYNEDILSNINSIALDNIGNVYIAGSRALGGGSSSLVGMKFNSSGNSFWTQYCTFANNSVAGQEIDLDSSGYIYIAGHDGYAAAPPGDCILWKLDNNGNSIWTQRYNDGDVDRFWCVKVDSDENIYAAGISGNWASRRIMVIKYSNNGNAFWTNYYDDGLSDLLYGFDFDQTGGYYVTGFVNYPANPRWCTLKYNSSNQTVWTQQHDTANSDQALALEVDDQDNVYVVGYTNEAGAQNAVIIKYQSSKPRSWIMSYDGGYGNDSFIDVYIDHLNYLYAVGKTRNSSGDDEFLAIKYDLNGNMIWTHLYNPGSEYDTLSAVHVDTSGYIYLGGYHTIGGDNNGYIGKYIQPPYPDPSLISCTVLSDNTIKVSWNNSTINEANYRIYRSTNNMDFVFYSEVSVDTSEYIDSNVNSDQKYYYKISAVNQAGESILSSSMGASTGPVHKIFSVEDVILVPNPFNMNKTQKGYITFYQVPNDAQITIYNILNKKIIELKNPDSGNQIIWNVKDENNNKLKRGMYLAQIIDSHDNMRTIKFVIHQ